jgi:hypothetical protein
MVAARTSDLRLAAVIVSNSRFPFAAFAWADIGPRVCTATRTLESKFTIAMDAREFDFVPRRLYILINAVTGEVKF